MDIKIDDIDFYFNLKKYYFCILKNIVEKVLFFYNFLFNLKHKKITFYK